MGHGILVCVASCGLLLCAAGRTWGKQDDKKFFAGSDTSLPWTGKDINVCRQEGKPVLLYIYDPSPGSAASAAFHFEQRVFPCPFVKEALKGFNCVKLAVKSTQGWPPSFAALAEKGAVLFLMTCACDGQQSVTYGRQSLPKYVRGDDKQYTCPEVIAAARQMAQTNAAAAESLKKCRPAKWAPILAKAAEPERKVAEPEEKPVVAAVPGLEDPTKKEVPREPSRKVDESKKPEPPDKPEGKKAAPAKKPIEEE